MAPLPRPRALGNPALRASVPRSGPSTLHRPSLCVVDILKYFRPWFYGLKLAAGGPFKSINRRLARLLALSLLRIGVTVFVSC